MLRCVYYCSLFTRFCSCVFLGLCCFVFFFKQKTAYEMRISDWSSDVCSSDLRSSIPAVFPPGQAGSLRRCRPCRLDLCLCCARRLGRLFVAGSAPLFRPDWFPGGPRHYRCSHREPQVVIIGLPMSMRGRRKWHPPRNGIEARLLNGGRSVYMHHILRKYSDTVPSTLKTISKKEERRVGKK